MPKGDPAQCWVPCSTTIVLVCYVLSMCCTLEPAITSGLYKYYIVTCSSAYGGHLKYVYIGFSLL